MGHLIHPVVIPVAIDNRFQGSTKYTRSISITALADDVPAAIILIRPGSAGRATCSIGLVIDPDQLAQGVIGIAYICSAYAITASHNVFQMNGKNGELYYEMFSSR